MKKGFTLIELMAILVLLSIIALITTPIVFSDLKESKSTIYNAQIKQIEKGAQEWAAKNSRDLPSENESINLTLGGLINEGYVDKDIVDPTNKNPFPNCMYIEITNKNNNYHYKVLDDKLPEGCSSNNDVFASNIILKGNYHMKIKQNDPFIDPGVKIKSISNNTFDNLETKYYKKINNNYVIVDKILTNELAKYKIVYTLTSNGTTDELIRYVDIIDAIPPIITIDNHTTDYTIEIPCNSSFILPTATAIDDIDGDISNKIITNSNLNPNIKGNYTLIYSVSDKAGNKRTLRITIKVK